MSAWCENRFVKGGDRAKSVVSAERPSDSLSPARAPGRAGADMPGPCLARRDRRTCLRVHTSRRVGCARRRAPAAPTPPARHAPRAPLAAHARSGLCATGVLSSWQPCRSVMCTIGPLPSRRPTQPPLCCALFSCRATAGGGGRAHAFCCSEREAAAWRPADAVLNPSAPSPTTALDRPCYADLILLGASAPAAHAASAGLRKSITPVSTHGPACSGAVRALVCRQSSLVNTHGLGTLIQGRSAMFTYPLAPAARMPPPRRARASRAPSGGAARPRRGGEKQGTPGVGGLGASAERLKGASETSLGLVWFGLRLYPHPG